MTSLEIGLPMLQVNADEGAVYSVERIEVPKFLRLQSVPLEIIVIDQRNWSDAFSEIRESATRMTEGRPANYHFAESYDAANELVSQRGDFYNATISWVRPETFRDAKAFAEGLQDLETTAFMMTPGLRTTTTTSRRRSDSGKIKYEPNRTSSSPGMLFRSLHRDILQEKDVVVFPNHITLHRAYLILQAYLEDPLN